MIWYWMVELAKHLCGPSKFILKSHVCNDFYQPLVCDPNKWWHVSVRVTYSGRVQELNQTVHRCDIERELFHYMALVWYWFFCPVLHVTLHVACMLCPLPSTTDDFSCEFGSSKYYALCGFGGILSCGLTHTAVVPLDLVKCRLQVCMETEPHGSNE